MSLLQHSAQYLSRRQSRDLGHNHHPAQLFVRREPVRDEGGEFAGVHRPVRRDSRDDRFAVGHVVDAEHRAVVDGGMAVQHRLDLGGRDLESPAP